MIPHQNRTMPLLGMRQPLPLLTRRSGPPAMRLTAQRRKATAARAPCSLTSQCKWMSKRQNRRSNPCTKSCIIVGNQRPPSGMMQGKAVEQALKQARQSKTLKHKALKSDALKSKALPEGAL